MSSVDRHANGADAGRRMIIIGLDISSTNVGVCVLEDGAPVHHETISFKGDLVRRLLGAFIRFRAVLVRWQPTVIGIEGAAFRTTALAMIAQQRMVGVFIAAIAAEGRPVDLLDVPPAVAKKALSGRGNADKAMMQLAARQYLDDADEHAADALAVALATQGLLATRALQPAKRRRAA